VRLGVRGPSYLVLGQSYDKGRRATCDGHDLGEPVPLQGYANGWPVDRGCRAASFAYRPQRLADAAYWVGGLACLALVAFLAASALRSTRRGPTHPAVGRTSRPSTSLCGGERTVRSLAPAHALAVALPVAAAVGVGFGLRAGAVAAPLLALVLWRGVSDKALTLAAAAVLGIAVPLVYVGVAVFGGEQVIGGNSTQYGADRLAAHWLAVGAFVALAVVLWRTLAAARAADRAEPPIASRR
jgi:arabinofuranan 3-O-arabinosyltransferase